MGPPVSYCNWSIKKNGKKFVLRTKREGGDIPKLHQTAIFGCIQVFSVKGFYHTYCRQMEVCPQNKLFAVSVFLFLLKQGFSCAQKYCPKIPITDKITGTCTILFPNEVHQLNASVAWVPFSILQPPPRKTFSVGPSPKFSQHSVPLVTSWVQTPDW